MHKARHTRLTFTTGKSYRFLEILLNMNEGVGVKGAELLCNPAAPIGLDVSSAPGSCTLTMCHQASGTLPKTLPRASPRGAAFLIPK